jgi:hypothetical protein
MLSSNTSRQRTDESHWCLVQGCLPPLRFAVSWLRFLVVVLPDHSLWVSEITSIKLTRTEKITKL